MYKSLESFHADKRAARVDRDRYTDSLSTRWARLQDPGTRGVLLRDAVGDVLRNWKPYRSIHDLLHGRVSGDMVSSLGLAAAWLHRSWTKRLLYSGLSLLLGKAMGRNGVPEGPGMLMSVANGIKAVVKHMRERRARKMAGEKELHEQD